MLKYASVMQQKKHSLLLTKTLIYYIIAHMINILLYHLLQWHILVYPSMYE